MLLGAWPGIWRSEMAGVLGLYLALEVARNQASTLMYVSSWVSEVPANVRW